jgi:hypothetical protein
MIDIEDVKRLTLGPDEMLILQVKGHVTRSAEIYLKNLFSGNPALKNKVVVMDSTVSLAVVSAKEAKSRAA